MKLSKPLEGKRILLTGGTGSLGQVLVRRILGGEMGRPEKIVVLSRDEAKQHYMRVEYQHRVAAADGMDYREFQRLLTFWIGDVRDYSTIAQAVRGADVVINAAAMKQVPVCEYFPYEAVRTNIGGAENIVRAIQEHDLPVETVIGVSTDKACKPVNTMGLTKAIQERIFQNANIRSPSTRFVCIRCGNVLASRGSVVPLFHDQIRHGGPVTVTSAEMTRFLISLNDAVDCLFAALRDGRRGEIYVPRAPSAKVIHLAEALIGDRSIQTIITGIRPGEKIHEIMVSDEEAYRTVARDRWYVIQPMLPEVLTDQHWQPALTHEYSSGDTVLTFEETYELLRSRNLLLPSDSEKDLANAQPAGVFMGELMR